MNFPAQVFADALISASIALVSGGLGWLVGGQARRSAAGTALLVLPLLMPALLISYAGAPLALPLIGTPWLPLFHAVVLGLKLLPLAILARDLFPPAVSAEANYCLRLLPPAGRLRRGMFALRSAGPTPWTVLAVLFLLAFTDFELASLLSLKRWTVMLFDAHAGGLATFESLRRMAWPLGIEGLVLAVLAWLFRCHASHPPGPETLRRRPLWPVLLLALVVAGAPLGRLVWQAAPGLATLGSQQVFAADLLVSLGLAVAAAGAAWLLAGCPRSATARALLALPGLLGGLVLALLFLTAIQWPGLRWLRDSPLPLIGAEALLLVPIALFLRALLAAQRPAEALHLARMAGSRRLLWDLAVQPRALALALLFILAYSELTAATILAPIGLTPVFARLHNLAHYGQTAVLSALLLAAVAAPAALLALTLGAARLYARRDAR